MPSETSRSPLLEAHRFLRRGPVNAEAWSQLVRAAARLVLGHVRPGRWIVNRLRLPCDQPVLYEYLPRARARAVDAVRRTDHLVVGPAPPIRALPRTILQFRLDELIRSLLKARDDAREVITDPHARYFGIAPSERTLLPGNDAQIANTHLDDWLRNAQALRRDSQASGPPAALPGVAPVAMQEGRHAAAVVKDRLEGRPGRRFHYFDKGNLATIGRARAGRRSASPPTGAEHG